MQIPLQISTRNMELTPAIEEAIRERAARLERVHDGIISCRVMVETPHRHHHKGHAHNIRIDLTVPGNEVVIKREAHPDLYVAIRDAFDAARRRLKSMQRRRRAHHIHGEPTQPVPAWISDLDAEGGFGFITTGEGRELYFEQDAVAGHRFDRLALGVPVHVIEREGALEPSAAQVKPLHR